MVEEGEVVSEEEGEVRSSPAHKSSARKHSRDVDAVGARPVTDTDWRTPRDHRDARRDFRDSARGSARAGRDAHDSRGTPGRDFRDLERDMRGVREPPRDARDGGRGGGREVDFRTGSRGSDAPRWEPRDERDMRDLRAPPRGSISRTLSASAIRRSRSGDWSRRGDAGEVDVRFGRDMRSGSVNGPPGSPRPSPRNMRVRDREGDHSLHARPGRDERGVTAGPDSHRHGRAVGPTADRFGPPPFGRSTSTPDFRDRPRDNGRDRTRDRAREQRRGSEDHRRDSARARDDRGASVDLSGGRQGPEIGRERPADFDFRRRESIGESRSTGDTAARRGSPRARAHDQPHDRGVVGSPRAPRGSSQHAVESPRGRRESTSEHTVDYRRDPERSGSVDYRSRKDERDRRGDASGRDYRRDRDRDARRRGGSQDRGAEQGASRSHESSDNRSDQIRQASRPSNGEVAADAGQGTAGKASASEASLQSGSSARWGAAAPGSGSHVAQSPKRTSSSTDADAAGSAKEASSSSFEAALAHVRARTAAAAGEVRLGDAVQPTAAQPTVAAPIGGHQQETDVAAAAAAVLGLSRSSSSDPPAAAEPEQAEASKAEAAGWGASTKSKAAAEQAPEPTKSQEKEESEAVKLQRQLELDRIMPTQAEILAGIQRLEAEVTATSKSLVRLRGVVDSQKRRRTQHERQLQVRAATRVRRRKARAEARLAATAADAQRKLSAGAAVARTVDLSFFKFLGGVVALEAPHPTVRRVGARRPAFAAARTLDAGYHVASILLENRGRAVVAGEACPTAADRHTRITRPGRAAVTDNLVGLPSDVDSSAPASGMALALLSLRTPAFTPGTPAAKPAYRSVQDAPCYAKNITSHMAKKEAISRVLAGRRALRHERLVELGRKYVSLRRTYEKDIAAVEERERAAAEAEALVAPRRGSSRVAAAAGFDTRASRGSSSSLLGGERASSRLMTSRSDIARSDYEQEQLLQELMLKEQREASRQKTILRKIPNQLDFEDRSVQAMRANDNNIYSTDGAYARCYGLSPREPCPRIPGYMGCNCARGVEIERRRVNPWTDIEKLVFIDRFLQYPKNFFKVAAGLANKDARDCVSFYYDVKKLAGFKRLLRQHGTALRRRETRDGWIVVVRAAQAIGVPLPDAVLESTLPNAPVLPIHESMPDISYSMLPYRIPKVPADRSAQERRRRLRQEGVADDADSMDADEGEKVRRDADAFATYIGGGVPATLTTLEPNTPQPTALQRALSLPSPFPFSAVARPPQLMDDTDVGTEAAEAAESMLAAMPPNEAFGGRVEVEALGYGAPAVHYRPVQPFVAGSEGVGEAASLTLSGGYVGSVTASTQVMSARPPPTSRFPAGWNPLAATTDLPAEGTGSAGADATAAAALPAKGRSRATTRGSAAAAAAAVSVRAPVTRATGLSKRASPPPSEVVSAVAPVAGDAGAAAAQAGATMQGGSGTLSSVGAQGGAKPQAEKRKATDSASEPAAKRRPPVKWSEEEKTQFVDNFRIHGRQWRKLAELLPTKTQNQLKHFYQTNKTKLGLEAMVDDTGKPVRPRDAGIKARQAKAERAAAEAAAAAAAAEEDRAAHAEQERTVKAASAPAEGTQPVEPAAADASGAPEAPSSVGAKPTTADEGDVIEVASSPCFLSDVDMGNGDAKTAGSAAPGTSVPVPGAPGGDTAPVAKPDGPAAKPDVTSAVDPPAGAASQAEASNAAPASSETPALATTLPGSAPGKASAETVEVAPSSSTV